MPAVVWVVLPGSPGPSAEQAYKLSGWDQLLSTRLDMPPFLEPVV